MIPSINQELDLESESPAQSICVIGAGTSGLLTLRALLAKGLAVECFEMSDRPGGLWVYENINQRSAAYASLRIDSSKQAMAISDFPFPAHVQDFPNHEEVQAYLSAYANKFDLPRVIHFRHEVLRCERAEKGYRVQVSNLATQSVTWRHYSHVVVSNGHHHQPAFSAPSPIDRFGGEVMHSQQYRTPEQPLSLGSSKVLVIGFGNSAADIAVELSKASSQVSLSVRRGAWVLPRYLFGKPIDQGHLIPYWIPGKLRRWIVSFSMQCLRGKMTDYGLPKPDHLIGEAHPTLSDELPDLVKSKQVKIFPKISSFEKKEVVFDDGSREEFDVLIYCTGYDLFFPFLDETEVNVRENSLPLYLRIFHPQSPELFFIGLAQTIGPIIPVAERQAQLLADYLAGDYCLPPQENMLSEMAKEEGALQRRFISSRRHTMQIDPPKYLRKLAKERRRGQQRAKNLKKTTG